MPYLIKTILCSAFFMLFYKTILGESKSYKFNRYYLIATMVLSFIIPVLPMPAKSPPLTTYLVPVLQKTEETIPTLPMEMSETQAYNPLLFIYLLITGILICRSLYHLYRMWKSILQATIQKGDGATFVLSNNISSSYTFLNYIFVQFGRSLPEEIIRHEMTHVRQRHTLDILFVELLFTFCWFNPILLLYRKYIALNHEYLADENVLKACADKKRYLNILLSVCDSENNMTLSHQFNHSITIKKRVKMIMKKSTKTGQWLRFVAIVPLFTASLFLFSGSSYNTAENPIQQKEPQVSTAVESSSENDALYKEYMQIIEKYKSEKDGKIMINIGISESDQSRMKELFLSMTPEQQSTLPLIFQRMKMPEPKIPTAAEFESWKNPSDYGIWIDEKRVDNSELNKYQPSDFSHYFKNRLASNAKNYGKHVYQLNISTNSHYQAQKAKKDADETLYLFPNTRY